MGDGNNVHPAQLAAVMTATGIKDHLGAGGGGAFRPPMQPPRNQRKYLNRLKFYEAILKTQPHLQRGFYEGAREGMQIGRAGTAAIGAVLAAGAGHKIGRHSKENRNKPEPKPNPKYETLYEHWFRHGASNPRTRERFYP